MENFEIKLLRLKSGEDIICFCFEDFKNQKVYIRHPKTFYVNYDIESESLGDLLLVDWLPPQAFAYQEVILNTSDILFVSYSTMSFGVRYLKSLIENLDPDSDLVKQINVSLREFSSDKDESTGPKVFH